MLAAEIIGEYIIPNISTGKILSNILFLNRWLVTINEQTCNKLVNKHTVFNLVARFITWH